MTTTATVSITITCPDWCTTSAEEHAAELWNMGGCCVHTSAWVDIDDPVGVCRAPLEPFEPTRPLAMQLSASTTPNGEPQASPVLIVEGRECSLEQAEALADAIRDLVATYRSDPTDPRASSSDQEASAR